MKGEQAHDAGAHEPEVDLPRALEGPGPTEVVGLLVAQLAQVIDETDSAAAAIVDAIGRVDATAGGLTETLRTTMASFESLQRSWSTDAGEASASAELERHASAQSAARAVFEARATELKVKLGQLASTGKTAETLSLEAKILALNSKLEAARLGSSAAGFAVIAGEMARISGSSRQVSAEIDEAVALASSVVDQQSAAREHEASTLDGMVQRQRALIGEYEALKRSYEAALGEIDASSRALSSAISDALAQIQFQDIVRQRLEHLIRGVEAISGEGASWATAVEVLASAYKMSAERVVHESVTGEALGGHETSRKIELF